MLGCTSGPRGPTHGLGSDAALRWGSGGAPVGLSRQHWHGLSLGASHSLVAVLRARWPGSRKKALCSSITKPGSTQICAGNTQPLPPWESVTCGFFISSILIFNLILI